MKKGFSEEKKEGELPERRSERSEFQKGRRRSKRVGLDEKEKDVGRKEGIGRIQSLPKEFCRKSYNGYYRTEKRVGGVFA